MFFFDPLYLIVALPALLLGLYAQLKVKGAFARYSRVRTHRGLTGAQAARVLLDSFGLSDVTIEETGGLLTDHYDPRSRTLRLSPQVARGNSVASLGVAAHETGHALQHAEGYAPLKLRSSMVPTVQFGSWLGPIIFFIGLMMSYQGVPLGQPLAVLGLLGFAAIAVFAVVTLPVEYDASRRAKKLLVAQGLVFQDEMRGVNAVLDAAALTYVAAAVQAIITLLYYSFLLFGRRRD